MESRSGDSVSLWLATAGLEHVPPLKDDAAADVCVIGAGIAGLSTAYELALGGRSVIVIDMGRIGDGMTGRTTAHFSNAFDDRYFQVERLHGADGAQLVAQSHTAAIRRTAAIAEHEAISCDLELLDGWLFAPPGESPGLLEREFAAAQRAGVPGVELATRAPLDGITGPALRFPDQLQLHPLKYLAGLARAITRLGGRIHGETKATRLHGGDKARVETSTGATIRAQAIVVATNTPFNDLAVMHTKQAAYQTYVIAAQVPAGSVTRALYWDTLDPYHYVRLQKVESGHTARELLIVGGEDHKTGQAEHSERRWSKLEEWMRTVFPSAGEVELRWSGEVMEPVDALGYIGKNPLDDDNVFIVTGDSGNGMTHGVIAGLLLSDLIQGRDHPWAEIYRPSRRTLRAAAEFAKENLNVAKEYAAWLAPGSVERIEDIAQGEGAVVRRGMSMHAVYVDQAGVPHERSAVCPHLGCVVQWNNAEKTWDCPCHGSRFATDGNVIHGPANKGLAAAPDPESKR
jgi:glycine/D-amino acid oxidase-like deaminating enzyme/nitrite reductase/ring-hydroxylating ferredoxin subunit